MGKISFGKLNLTKNTEIKTINWNDQVIEVKQYLPVEEKINIVINIMNSSIDNNNFYNPCKLDVHSIINIILGYTDITLTDKQKEDAGKLYDLFIGSGFKDAVFTAIPKSEINYIIEGVDASISEIYKYRNSVLGLMDTIVEKYKNQEFDAAKIKADLADPENLTLLKDVLAKLG